MSRTVRPDKGDPEPPSAIQRELATAADPTPENVLAGLEVQEKSLRELRRYLFTRLFQLQVRLAPARSPSPSRAVSVALTPPPPPRRRSNALSTLRRRRRPCCGTSSRSTDGLGRPNRTMPPIERDEKKLVYKRGKRRVAAKQPSPARCLEWLRGSNLHGVLCRNAVWLACTRQLAYFLERVCLGRRAQAEAAAGVPVFANALGAGASAGADAEARPVVVRLSPEEAFYMAHQMDCLTVHGVERGAPPGEAVSSPAASAGGESADGDGEGGAWLMRLSRTELWRALARLGAERPEDGKSPGGGFIAKYAAHAHFRNQGWLPRSGLQYGADFVLYRNHPSLVHSDFCVVLAPDAGGGASGDAEANAGEIAPTAPRARLGLRKWTEVQAASRLCVQVNKGLISASVTFSETADASTPACLRSIAVEETEVRRFNPERNKP